ncbi:unnamed protein product [Closterium sp. NIES-65]|nr:unnamed protein product [Closterium sp. NIES-65]
MPPIHRLFSYCLKITSSSLPHTTLICTLSLTFFLPPPPPLPPPLFQLQYDHSGRTPVVSAKIWGAAPQVRADRRKDRVETTPEQLAAASAEAERMSVATGMRTRVIGWYHSHPHITVHPSHVDVRTQGMYQMLDEGFVGLIFSAFNRASSHAQAGQLQAVAFQSVSARDKEQREQRSQHTPARGQWAQLGTKREHSSHPSVSDLEPQELAVVLAAVDDDVPSSDFTAWEVPIKVVSSARAFPSLPRAHAVAPLTGLQRMLLVEEKEAYEKAVEHAGRWVVMPAISPLCLKLTQLQWMLLMEEKEAYEKAVEHTGRHVHIALFPSALLHGEPNPLELIHRHRRLPGLPIILSFPSPLLSPLPSPLPTLSLPLFPPSPLPSSHPLPSPLSTPDTASLTLWS